MKFEKVNKLIFVLGIGIVLTSPNSSLWAARSKTKTVKIKQSRTVGDILKNIRKTGSKSKTKLQFGSGFGAVTNEAKNRNIRAIKPPSEKKFSRSSSSKDISRLEQVVDKSIAQMYRLIKKYKKSKRRGELWLRQGELYVEKARLVEQRIFNDFDKKIELWEKKKLRRKPKINLEPAKEYYRKSETLYSWFLRDFSKDPKMDQALFFLGYINFELGQNKKGQHYYTLLTKRYKRSSYVTEAYFALGEYYFERDEWKNALEQYDKVIRKKKNRLYSFAFYKRAWCLYRVGLGGKAVKSLEKVIVTARQAKRDGVSSADSRIRLATEALRDIVLFYSESGSYKGAEKYFRVLAGTKPSRKMLENLAYLYSSKGRLLESRYIFKTLIAKSPSDENSYKYQKQIVLNYSNAGNRKAYKKELVTWVRDYGKDSRWFSRNSDNEKIIADSEKTREKLLRVHTLKWHQNYQNTKTKQAVKESMFGYDLYFEHFPKSKYTHQMYFYSAELLFDLNIYKKSSVQYQKAVDTAKYGKAKFLKKASLNRLISIEKTLPSTQKMEAKNSTSVEPVRMPSTVRDFVLAGRDHVKRFPKDKSSLEVKFRIARIYYLYNHFEPAEQMFKEVVKEGPRSKYAEYSANLLLDIYNIKEDYSGMAKVGNEILSVKGFQNSQLTNDIQNIVEKAAFNQGQGYEKKGNYIAAAQSFKAFANQYPGSDLTIAALYNAGVNYERAGSIIAAIPLYEKVKKSPRKSNKDIAKKAMLLQANLYEKTGDLEKAAYAYESYANKYKKDKIRSNLYYNAALIFNGARKYKRSINVYEKYYALNSRSNAGKKSLFSIAKAYEALGSRSKAKQYYNKFLNASRPTGADYAEAAFNLAKIYERERSSKKANNWFLHIVNKVKGKGKVTYYRAASKLKLTLQYYNSFVRIRVPKDTKKQQKIVQKKISMLERLNNDFASIIRLDSGEQVISSLIWSGKAYEHMGDSILKAPMPPKLNAAQKKQYSDQLKRITDPMYKTSNDNYKAAVAKSFELDLYSKDISIAFEKLAKKNPTEYPYWDFKAFTTQSIDSLGEDR